MIYNNQNKQPSMILYNLTKKKRKTNIIITITIIRMLQTETK